MQFLRVFSQIFADLTADFADPGAVVHKHNPRKSAYHLRKSARNLIAILILVSAFFFRISLLGAQDTLMLHYSKSITKEELSIHVYKLASDEFEGRYTGSKGQLKAAEYINDEFKACGLEAPQIAGKPSYSQDFTLDNCRWKDQRLFIDGNEFMVGKDFLFLSDPVDIKGEFPVIFAGFGIDDSIYSDFGSIDVRGKIMLAFTGEPKNEEGISYISGRKELSRKGYYFSKAALAEEKGAEGVFIISRKKSDYKKFLKARDYYDPKPKISYPHNDEDTLMHRNAFAAYMNVKTAARLVNQKPGSLVDALDEMETGLKTAAGRFTGQASIEATSECTGLQTGNVVGIIEGTDLKNEAVVVVAHYDHLGIRQGQTYYGADDNASGTSAVIEIAEAFALAAREGIRPRRTVIFLAVSAEELGLYGSKYYSKNPVISLDSTYACLNIDMIGRAGSKQLDSPDYIGGYAYVSAKILEVSRQAISLTSPGLEDRMDYRDHLRGGSDHYYFARHGIPSLFYFTGFHNDYHEPTDIPNKILYDRMEQIVRAIFATTWVLANSSGELISE